jgi:hypothetical protein
MQVNNPSVLRSLTNEAGRQADFYHRRTGAEAELQFWSALEALASEARRNGHSLVIEKRDYSGNPIPIKACEQSEQLPTNHVIKAIQ